MFGPTWGKAPYVVGFTIIIGSFVLVSRLGAYRQHGMCTWLPRPVGLYTLQTKIMMVVKISDSSRSLKVVNIEYSVEVDARDPSSQPAQTSLLLWMVVWHGMHVQAPLYLTAKHHTGQLDLLPRLVTLVTELQLVAISVVRASLRLCSFL